VLGAIGLVVAGSATLVMLPDPPPEAGAGHVARASTAWRNRSVLLLGAIVLAAMLSEGAAADWSAVYLHESVGAPVAFAALGYAAFAVAMVVGRLTGDRLLAWIAPRTILPVLAMMATVGMGAALVIGGPAIALIGFATLGLGVALVIPAAFTAAGRLPGVHPGAAVAVVSSVGWVGFVAGPPLIGHLSEAVTLTVALALLPVLTAAIAVSVRGSRVFGPPAPAGD
jgi:fucose permease